MCKDSRRDEKDELSYRALGSILERLYSFSLSVKKKEDYDAVGIRNVLKMTIVERNMHRAGS